MKQSVDIKGITTTSAYKDGDCMSMVNMRKKNGVLKPVSPRKISMTFASKYDELFVHNLPASGENWIGIKSFAVQDNTYNYSGPWSSLNAYITGNAVYFQGNYYVSKIPNTDQYPTDATYWRQLTGVVTIINTILTEHIDAYQALLYIQNPGQSIQTDTLICTVSSVPQITQIGNILNILDSEGLKYIIWYENKYILIGSNFDGVQTDTVLGPIKVDLQVNGQTLTSQGHTTPVVRLYQSETIFAYNSLSDSTSDANKKTRADEVKGLMTKAIAGMTTDGFTHGFFMSCVAIELYDGSFILQSNPVILCQPDDAHARYSNYSVDGQICDYINNPAIFQDSWFNQQSLPNSVKSTWALNSTTLVDFNVGVDGYSLWQASPSFYAFKKDSTDLLAASTPNIPLLLGNYVRNYQDGGVWGCPVTVSARLNKLQYKISNQINEELKPLIKSVSIFMTEQTSLYKLQDVDLVSVIGDAVVLQGSGNNSTGVENYLPVAKTNDEIIKEMLTKQIFYRVMEIPFDDVVVGSTSTTAPVVDTWIDIDLSSKTNGYLENLIYQIQLPVDNFTHHTLIPQKQMVYNSRLHILDYKTIFSHGWPIAYLQANQGTGQFQPVQWSPNIPLCANAWYIKVDIQTTTGISSVVRYFIGTTPNFGGSDLMPMLSYPDSRAVKITLYQYYTSSQSFGIHSEYKLTESDNQNYAYYISPDLKPISFVPVAAASQETIPAEVEPKEIFENGLKVSALNDPFNFPAATTYLVGTGIAYNAASNSMRASDGQFGQYPVYVFTSEKIYAINVGDGTIVYSNITPISDETPISGIICQTPFGIVFVAKRGIFIINGQQVTFLSVLLEQEPIVTSITNPAVPFITFLETLNNILYDNQKNELIFVNGSDYNYVLNIDTKMWYLSTEKIESEVKNIYPELQVLDYNSTETQTRVKDFEFAEIAQAQVSLLTRAMFFGVDEVKTMLRSILRGRFFNLNTDTNQFISLYGSKDGITFTLLRGFILLADKQGLNHKDFDLGLMSKSTYRNYILAFNAQIDETSEIDFIDFQISDDYSNEKMR